MAKKNKFFVVWDGREPGIYTSWDECKRQVNGYPDAKYMGFLTQAEAREAFLSPYWDYVGKKHKSPQPTPEQIAAVGLPLTESIAVDAACSGNPGAMEYQGVYVRTGELLFKQGPFANGTNNIGEFLALVHGLAFLKQRNSSLPIYSDSKIAISWVQQKKAKTRLDESADNKVLFELIERAEKWLAENVYPNEIRKWKTEVWGEIPADFGRK
ncbi:MAG: ribonuclease H-related protein [Bacteroidetes bacterium]|nr:ribonuclease H-related protein [Bacteroidota bacterium]